MHGMKRLYNYVYGRGMNVMPWLAVRIECHAYTSHASHPYKISLSKSLRAKISFRGREALLHAFHVSQTVHEKKKKKKKKIKGKIYRPKLFPNKSYHTFVLDGNVVDEFLNGTFSFAFIRCTRRDVPVITILNWNERILFQSTEFIYVWSCGMSGCKFHPTIKPRWMGEYHECLQYSRFWARPFHNAN